MLDLLLSGSAMALVGPVWYLPGSAQQGKKSLYGYVLVGNGTWECR